MFYSFFLQIVTIIIHVIFLTIDYLHKYYLSFGVIVPVTC